MKKHLIATVLSIVSSPLMAAGLINDMQTCQGFLNFIDTKLNTAPAEYAQQDITTVRNGLNAYNHFIQTEIVTPGLLQFNHGDKAKANQMQKQVDDYKQTLVNQLQKRYPQDRLFMDHAIAINNCAKKAVPKGNDLEALKTSLQTMVKLAKLQP